MATTAQSIVDAMRAAILANPATLSVSVDGISSSFASLADRDASLKGWENRAAVEAGTSSTKSFVTRGRPV
jgi:hypothetical protein